MLNALIGEIINKHAREELKQDGFRKFLVEIESSGLPLPSQRPEQTLVEFEPRLYVLQMDMS